MGSGSKDQLLESEYDGIQEYDNDLPGWWRALFAVTVVLGTAYAGYMHLVSGESSQQQFARQIAAEKQQAIQIQAQQPVVSGPEEEAALLKLTADTQVLANGKGVFVTRCSPCHGPDGQGIVGPNLTDDYWIHGGKITDIRTVIENGVLDKGMLAWKTMLPQDDLKAVVAYIYSIRGTNPANPKPPQGDLVVR